ncbi:MAG: ABC transporter substrate-binding protein [Micromonosporaceae bacterium]
MRDHRLNPLRAGVALIAGLALLTACAPGGGADADAPKPGSTDFKGKTMTYVYFTDGPDEQATRDRIAAFEKQTGAKVNLQVVPYADLEQSLQARLSGSDAPDVARLTNVHPFADDLVDLRDFLGKDYGGEFLEGQVKAGTSGDGALIAVPSDLTINGPFVNVDQFKKANVAIPEKWSWDELIAAAKKVQQANKTEFALAMDKSGHRMSTMLSQYGTVMIGPDGKPGLDLAKAESAIKTLTDLHRSDAMSKDFWLGSGTKYKGANDIFLAGAAPVYLSGNWQVSQFATDAEFEWGVAPNPCAERCGGFPGGKFMGAFKKSKNPTLAAAFIEFMNTKESQQAICAKAAFLPTRNDLVSSGVTYDARGDDMATFIADVKATPADTYSSLASPAFGPSAEALVEEISKVIAGQQNAKQAAANLEKAITTAVEETSG